MKRIVLCFSLILTLLCFPKNVISQENITGSDQDQALELAGRLAELKSSSSSQMDDTSAGDISGFVNRAYEAWDNNNFDKAIEYFKKAQIIEPGNKKLNDLVYDVEREKMRYEEQKVAIAKEIIKQKRMLEIDKAGLISEPETTRSSAKVKTDQRVTLRMKAASKRVSVDFNNAELNKILEYLSQVSDINIIMDEDALARSPQVSIILKNVTLIQALESILRTKGLSYRFEDDFIWVSSKENIANEALTTRVYHLSQGLASFTAFTTFDTVTIEGLRGDNEIVMSENKAEDKNESSGSGVRTYEGVKVGGPSGVAGNITVTIENVLKQFVGWPEGSRIFLDKRTSKLIVRNTPSNLAILEDVIEALDVNPPQVMIEARFVEIGADDLYSLGVKMSAEVSAEGATSPTTFPFNKNQNTKYSSAFPSPTTDQFAFGTLNFSQFQAVLSAIEQNTNTNTLSSPKITTISGQEAVIKIVKEYRYPTKYEIEVIRVENAAGETVTQSFPVPVEFKTRDIGIILRVTPNVGADDKTINLTLVPEVSEFDIDKDMYNYGTEERPFLQPFFNTRNATASIIVNNKDTVVMGGLMREEVTKGVDRVPILGHLPILGNLFSRKVDNKQKRNLLIFVTASIIAPTGETVEKKADAL
ncbi:MAG: secretin and TonB N-terminal domain-containing protein [Candidatus Omnitrophota bacterium]